MVRTTTAALLLTAVLSFRVEGQALAGPRLRAFHALPLPETVLPLRTAQLDAQHRVTAVSRGRTFLEYTGLGLVIGAATGALVGPVLTNSACLAWRKDAANQATCLDAFFTPREHVRSAVMLAAVGAVVGAVTGLIARSGP